MKYELLVVMLLAFRVGVEMERGMVELICP